MRQGPRARGRLSFLDRVWPAYPMSGGRECGPMSYVVAESSRAVSLCLEGDRPDITDGCVVGGRAELTAAAGCALEGSSSSGDLERRVYAQAMGCAVLVLRVGENHSVVEGELGGFVDDVAGPTW